MDENQNCAFRIGHRIALHLFIVSSISIRTENLLWIYALLPALVINNMHLVSVDFFLLLRREPPLARLLISLGSQGFLKFGGSLCFYDLRFRLFEQM